MTHEQRAQRLEEMGYQIHGEAHEWLLFGRPDKRDADLADAALLRESAGLWRERDGVQWVKCGSDVYIAIYKTSLIKVLGWAADCWIVTVRNHAGMGGREITSQHSSLPAAQAAAVAWVDGQEGK